MSLKIKLTPEIQSIPRRITVVGNDNILRTQSARFTNSSQPMMSESANTCVMLGLNADKNKDCLMHLAPEQQSLRTLRDGIEACIEKMRENIRSLQENFSGILIGGRHSAYPESFDLFNETANILDELGIPFSMICGKFDNIANDNILMRENNATIWNKSLQHLDVRKNVTQDELAKILEENYEVVELSPEVPVEFIG